MRVIFAVLPFVAQIFASGAVQARPLLMDPEMTSREYQALTRELLITEDGDSDNAAMRQLLVIGTRNLEWIDHLNSLRPADQQLQLSAAGLQPGNDIDHVRQNSPSILEARYQTWLGSAPQSVIDVLTSTTSYPDATGMADDDFLAVAREIDKIYDLASRWLLQSPHLDDYKLYRKYDVRGYVFLQREDDLATKLQNWTSLSAVEQARLAALLTGQCFNVEEKTDADCQSELATAASSGAVLAYFQNYLPAAKAVYDANFSIPVARTDVTWVGSAPLVLRVPFSDPHNQRVLDWLSDNIQDEFQWNGWHLNLNFVDSDADTMTHVVFEAGATPHVNDLAGNIITMDGNRNLDEYSERWTIRHEYGHVLGLPDCYVEFYDDALQAMVSYQLDLDNLMCSRRGHFLQAHFDELKRVYFKADQ